jgi:hypothetical protein
MLSIQGQNRPTNIVITQRQALDNKNQFILPFNTNSQTPDPKFISLPDEIIDKIRGYVRYNFEKEISNLYAIVKVPTPGEIEQGVARYYEKYPYMKSPDGPSWTPFNTDDSEIKFSAWWPSSYCNFCYFNCNTKEFVFYGKDGDWRRKTDKLSIRIADSSKYDWNNMEISGFKTEFTITSRESTAYGDDIEFDHRCYTEENIKNLTIKIPTCAYRKKEKVINKAFIKTALLLELLKVKWEHKQLL